MADSSNFISLANQLIAENGMEITFLARSANGEVNPKSGKREIEAREHKCMAVLVRPTKEELAQGHFQNISQVVLVPGDAIPVPSITDKLRFSGHEWDIAEIVTIEPSGVPILYKIGVKDAGHV